MSKSLLLARSAQLVLVSGSSRFGMNPVIATCFRTLVKQFVGERPKALGTTCIDICPTELLLQLPERPSPELELALRSVLLQRICLVVGSGQRR